jgi:hypothetical protein
MLIKKRVIKDVPEDVELENLMQQLNSDNQNKHPIPFQIIDEIRLEMKVKETNEETEEKIWVWKIRWRLAFKSKHLSLHVYDCNMKI